MKRKLLISGLFMLTMTIALFVSGIVQFQSQDTRYELLISFHDKWLAVGITLPYVISS